MSSDSSTNSIVEELCNNGLKSIVEATKAANALPGGSSRDAYCAYPTFGKVIDTQCDKILGIISRVLKHENIKGNIQRRQQDEQFEMILEYNDLLLERINSNLDEIGGLKKNPETILIESKIAINEAKIIENSGSWNTQKSKAREQSTRLIAAKNIVRPQINFKVPIDNNPDKPFIPRIKDKPNSLKPLAVLPEYDEYDNIVSYLQPYEFEICKFEPSNDLMTTKTVTMYKSLEESKLIYVENESQLKSCLEDLRKCPEIAVDLEHHSYRSFQGITCLMQISTKTMDYIIDTLKLREELQLLNEIFTNPKILKIFHGSDSDIEWLQRDLSLYVVNMFDTHQAAKLLGFPRLSLAYLLKHYCNIEANKTFQLADWRIRPLPEELLTYARQDTHYLIYIYEMIRNELLNKSNDQLNLIKTVFTKSSEICKKKYIKPIIHDDSHMDLYRRSKKIFDNRQLYALSKIFIWRDLIAREEDESCGYVLPNHMMLQIAESLPREMQGILACCNPIPPLVRQHLHAIHQIILKAREQPLVKPITEQIANRTMPISTTDCNNKLCCQQDLSHEAEFRDDLPTLLGPIAEKEVNVKSNIVLNRPKLEVFIPTKQINNENIISEITNKQAVQFVSPYERYKAVIPLAEKEKLEAIEREKAEDSVKVLCPIKKEKDELTQQTTLDLDQDKYSLPLKQSLKRKKAPNDSEDVDRKKTKPSEQIIDEDNPKFNRFSNSNKKGSKPPKKTTFEINVKDSSEKLNNSDSIEMKKHSNLTNGVNQPSTSKSNKKKKVRKGFSNKTSQSSNSSIQIQQNSKQPDQSTSFDYSKVNFNKFQGGAQKAKVKEVQSKFKGKGKMNNKNDKKFNKLFTFSNVNRKK